MLGISSYWHSWIKRSLSKSGSILTISVRTSDISVLEKTPPADTWNEHSKTQCTTVCWPPSKLPWFPRGCRAHFSYGDVIWQQHWFLKSPSSVQQQCNDIIVTEGCPVSPIKFWSWLYVKSSHKACIHKNELLEEQLVTYFGKYWNSSSIKAEISRWDEYNSTDEVPDARSH